MNIEAWMLLFRTIIGGVVVTLKVALIMAAFYEFVIAGRDDAGWGCLCSSLVVSIVFKRFFEG